MAVSVVAITGVMQDTAANWAASNVNIDRGVLCHESDTGKFKIGSTGGDQLYSALPYVIDQVFTSAYKALLDNVNLPNGLVKLDANGLIDPALIPASLKASPAFLATYADLAAIATAAERKAAVYYVMDATGDATVTAGWAAYIRNGTDTAWIKVGEGESLDLNLSAFMTTTETYLFQPPYPGAAYYTTP